MTDRFTDLLAVEELAPDRFEIASAGKGFLFGGLTMAAALAAVARTVAPGLVPRSLHTAFHAGGTWGDPLIVTVERINDTKSYATRRAAVSQGDVPVAVVDVAFRRDRGGADLTATAAPAVALPDALAPAAVSLPEPVMDVRYAGPVRSNGSERVHPYWVRFAESLPDDPAVHAAAVAFVSDYLVIYTPFEPGSGAGGGLVSRTLEHSLWFHRPVDASRWLLLDATPLSVTDGHYVSRGTVHDEGGALVASFVQEGFVRAEPTVLPPTGT